MNNENCTSDPRLLYLDLLKRTLLNWHYAETILTEMPEWSLKRRLLARYLRRSGLRACIPNPIPKEQLTDGVGIHTGAYSMVGMKRLDNVQYCATDVIENNIRGDFLEAGVWRGGTCIFMRGLLEAFQVTDRIVWVADSFQGLPQPNVDKYPHDADETLHEAAELAVPLEEVQSNFARFELLDDQVKFIEGFFSETLASAPIEHLAILRLDGDMYESTMDTLVALYPKLTAGGYLIVDDFQRDNCKQAVLDYRASQGIDEPIQEIDWVSAFWRKTQLTQPVDCQRMRSTG